MLSNSYIKKSDLSSNNKKYFTHFNGCRPFKVIANKKGIIIYDYTTKEKNGCNPILRYYKNFLGYWYGIDPEDNHNKGNSILIQISNHCYIHIGSEIYSFNTIDKILDFISPVGPNDVPYPVAYGEKYIYFMLDKNYINKEELDTPITVDNAFEIYREFYGHIGSKKGNFNKYNYNNVIELENSI